MLLGNHPLITKASRLIHSIKCVGTSTTFIWIPSHVGIVGNELADRLASRGHHTSNNPPTPNILTPSELRNTMSNDWNLRVLQFIYNHPKLADFPHLDFSPWLFHRNRQICTALHLLRNGHNRLKAQTACFQTSREDDPDSERDPWCRFGCGALENVPKF